jgi:hypothetical protein
MLSFHSTVARVKTDGGGSLVRKEAEWISVALIPNPNIHDALTQWLCARCQEPMPVDNDTNWEVKVVAHFL